MKKIFSIAGITCFGMLLLFASGCMKDRVTHTYQIQSPVYQTLTQARTVIKAGQSTDVGSPGKICLYKNYLFLNEASKGIHVIDNTDPAHPLNISFINIPGNTDLSVKNDILYANEGFGDLVAMDIKDPANVVIKKYLPAIFGSNYIYNGNAAANPDSVLVVTGWVTKDTTVNIDPDNPNIYPGGNCTNCEYLYSAASPNASGASIPKTIGTNGSTSGFAISDQYLYALSFGTVLNVVDISAVEDPALVNKLSVNDYYETIYPFENKLFMGSSNGMYIYDITDPSAPAKQGSFAHVRTCDPVIADGQHAFVTLRSGTTCQGYTNELDILDISNLSNPTLSKTYSLTNPRGLSKDGNLLFICDGTDGLKIYDAADINSLSLIKTIPGFEANEVIAMNGKAIVIATDGLYQFDYSDTGNIHQISKIDSHAAGQ